FRHGRRHRSARPHGPPAVSRTGGRGALPRLGRPAPGDAGRMAADQSGERTGVLRLRPLPQRRASVAGDGGVGGGVGGRRRMEGGENRQRPAGGKGRRRKADGPGHGCLGARCAGISGGLRSPPLHAGGDGRNMMVKKTTRFPGAADPDAADGRVRINNQGGNRMSDAPTARALTVAGSDSGGGAGIQADLKTFQEWLVYGMSVVTAVTAQNSLGVHGVWPLPADAVERQLRAVLEDFGADAVKTGMLPDRAAISATARVLAEHRIRRVVVDPVMVAKGGAALMEDGAVSALVNELLPLAELVTPNVPEACRLAGLKEITTLDQMAEAAVRIHRLGVRSVLFKGGHLTGLPADDLLFDGEEFLLYRGPRLSTIHTHGTGCTLSAAIAAALALGMSLADAVRAAKIYVTQAIRAASR